MTDDARDRWNERYLATPRVWSGSPNPVLIAEAAELAAGRALDIGCGEGADALWLAERGWQVLGIDVSDVAIDRARDEALSRTLPGRAEFQRADLREWVPERHTFDLVMAFFVHLPVDERDLVFTRLAAAVAPGGTLLLAGHAVNDATSGVGRPSAHLLVDEADLLPYAAGFSTVTTSTRAREVAGPSETPPLTVHDVVLVARR
jgi:2-polyprenyl-3-methyl-5-hydroxy-6-metoxy-1,4-benzoquinol methylase